MSDLRASPTERYTPSREGGPAVWGLDLGLLACVMAVYPDYRPGVARHCIRRRGSIRRILGETEHVRAQP